MCCGAISHLIMCQAHSEHPGSEDKHCPGGRCLPLPRQVRLPGDGACRTSTDRSLGLAEVRNTSRFGGDVKQKWSWLPVWGGWTKVCSKDIPVPQPSLLSSRGTWTPASSHFFFTDQGWGALSFQKPKNLSIRGRHKRQQGMKGTTNCWWDGLSSSRHLLGMVREKFRDWWGKESLKALKKKKKKKTNKF